ncbi:hypothetical protein NDA01_21590 [Trichocoleus desertorum AS-A10]|uniref:hypothetical protein n=1 Tax=Trichocoleus desertorum TaxID=1481672 RepID=UPI003296CFCC
MDLFNFPDTASFDDLFRLEDARIERFGTLLGLSPDITLFLDPYLVLVISGGPEVVDLKPELVHLYAWLVLSTETIALYSDNARIYKGAVPEGISRQALADLESGVSASAEVDDMATATLEKTLDVVETQTPTQRKAVPVIKSLRRIADKTGLSEEAIASEMLALNLNVFKDEESGFYKTPAADLEKWADRWSLQFAKKQREWLLQEEEIATETPTETNGKVEAESVEAADFNTDDEPTLIEEPVAEETAAAPTLPALKFNKKPRPSKDLNAKGYRETLDKSLKALNDNPDEQLIICSAIASPEETEMGSTALDLIAGLYSTADRQSKGARILKGLHTAAVQWMSEAKQTEPAATATT